MRPAPDSVTADSFDDEATEPRITIEMGGANIVIRASAHSDRAYTATIAEAINAATDSDTTVVLDPEPARCDDAFASYNDTVVDPECAIHDRCRPVAVDVMRAGVVRLRTERFSWVLDVNASRLCRLDRDTDVRFLSEAAWDRVVALCITRSRVASSSRAAHPLHRRRRRPRSRALPSP